MKSMEFIAQELLTTPRELVSKCKNRDLVRKRWVAMCFYRLMGLSLSRISAFLNLDYRTVLHGLKKADESIREKARELYLKFTNQEPDCKLLPKRSKIIRVPDYHTGKIITKEVEI
jgi:chromosomal replication initiation ATPase DnaA